MQHDPQRQKVYNAENLWVSACQRQGITIIGRTDLLTIEDTYQVLALEFDVSVPRVRWNQRLQQWAGWYKPGLIELRPPAKMATALHEFAHHMESSWHDWQFTQNYLAVVRYVAGVKAAENLERCYRIYHVATTEAVHQERRERALVAASQRVARDGKLGQVWIVHSDQFQLRAFLSHDSRHWDYNRKSAGAWRREATARKKADAWGGDCTQVDGEYVAEYGRWVVL